MAGEPDPPNPPTPEPPKPVQSAKPSFFQKAISFVAQFFNTPERTKNSLQGIVLFLIGVLILYFAWILFAQLKAEGELFSKLRDPGYARGMITFLITVSAIGLCFILVVQSFFGVDDANGERFRRGREVLTLLTGILGTIVGFYFGTTEKPQAELHVPEFQIVQKTNTLRQLMTHISGGVPPYRYNIRFQAGSGQTNAVPKGIENKLSEDG